MARFHGGCGWDMDWERRRQGPISSALIFRITQAHFKNLLVIKHVTNINLTVHCLFYLSQGVPTQDKVVTYIYKKPFHSNHCPSWMHLHIETGPRQAVFSSNFTILALENVIFSCLFVVLFLPSTKSYIYLLEKHRIPRSQTRRNWVGPSFFFVSSQDFG